MFALLGNLYRYIRSKTERKVCLIVLGVDNAGKTTLLNSLQGNLEAEATPTFGFNSTNTTSKALGLQGRQLSLQVFDLGGGKNIRRVWRSYLAEVHAVVFVVDAADSSRFKECQQVLTDTLAQPHLHSKPILVFANKQDLPEAASAAEVAQQLGLASLTQNAYSIVACTAKSAPGGVPDPRLQQGLTWLLRAVDEVYSVLHPRVEHDTQLARQEEARKKAERDERARKAREERLRKQAEEEAAEQLQQQQQPNALSSLPGAIESPKPGNASQCVTSTAVVSLGPAQDSPTTITIRHSNPVPSTSQGSPHAAMVMPAQTQDGFTSLMTEDNMQAQVSGVGAQQLAARPPSGSSSRAGSGGSHAQPPSSGGRQHSPSPLQLPRQSLQGSQIADVPSPPLPANLPSALPGMPPPAPLSDGSLRARSAAAGKLEAGEVARSASQKMAVIARSSSQMSADGKQKPPSLNGSVRMSLGGNKVVPVVGGGV